MAPTRPVVLVTGATGQLGVDLTAALAGAGATAVGAGSAGLDVTNRAVVSEAVAASGAEVVIHAGAWTAVDACEADPDRAFAVNALGTRNVAEAAARAGAHVCYVSTDYVFDGTSPRAYTEWDRPNPASVYGASKLAGEVEAGPGATVVRISWVFSPRGQNMARTVLRLAGEHPTLRFVDDQTGSPTSTADAAPAIVGLALERRPGVFHLTNQGTTTWFGFARAVMEAAGLDPARVEPISTAELDPPRPAPRPANSVLDNAALRLAGARLLPHWSEAVERVVKEMGR